jgi:hydroxymethylpyrimidine/phosphomethylpyrimidine kinase
MDTQKTSEKQITLHPKAIALTIAGSDPSGGAGLQADLKVFQKLGAYGMSVVTLITVQNTVGVQQVEVLPKSLFLAQLEAVVSDIPPAIAKIGALGNAELVDAMAERARSLPFPLVLDPVMISKHGDLLMEEEAIEVMRSKLLKNVFLLTPNRFEAERLTGLELSSEENVAQAIHDLHLMGARNVLMKLGQVNGKSQHILGDGKQNTATSVPWLDTKNTHGSGCVLSAATTARLARGEALDIAVSNAIRDTWQAIHAGQGYGQGFHPVEFQLIGSDEG